MTLCLLCKTVIVAAMRMEPRGGEGGECYRQPIHLDGGCDEALSSVEGPSSASVFFGD